MLACPKCGFEKEAEPGRRLEFCPNDGKTMERVARPEVESDADFELGWRKLQRELRTGVEYPTVGERESFVVLKVTPAEVVISPKSSMKERPIKLTEIKAVYRSWSVTRSYKSSDYQAQTLNSVYILRLIKEFWDRQS